MFLYAARAKTMARMPNATAVRGVFSKKDPAIAPYAAATAAKIQIKFIFYSSLMLVYNTRS
jgi:hypothetical protein